MVDLQVIHEDNHLIAVNKPAGWLVQGDITGDMPISEAVKAYIKDRYNKPGAVYLGTIHRLDRPVSGVVVFARTSKALTRMNKLFQEKAIQKTYWAITDTRPDPLEGHLTHYLIKDTNINKAKAFDRPSNRNKKAKKSELTYALKAGLAGHHLLEVHPQTGRPHQIRVQLSKIGCPIRGDVKYGHPTPNIDGSIHLHCREMSFIHPVKKEKVIITAEPPDEAIWNLFDLE